MKAFIDLFDDCTAQGCKIKTEEYKSHGHYAIIDQGQNDIAGYTDRVEGLYTDVPAIIFGDHTRIIKYIDVPFFLGADGVKLLKCKDNNANYKYLYYALRSVKIPNTGYNRHFKWLKEVFIKYPDKPEQEKIAEILDKTQELIVNRKQQLKVLDDLIKSRFVEMFGDPIINNKQWRVATVGELCFVTKLAGFEYTDYIHYQKQGDVIMIRGLNVKNQNWY